MKFADQDLKPMVNKHCIILHIILHRMTHHLGHKPNNGSSSNSGGTQPEKGKPWCNVPNRKTPTHILQRRRDAYYRRKEQKLFETNGQSKPRYVF